MIISERRNRLSIIKQYNLLLLLLPLLLSLLFPIEWRSEGLLILLRILDLRHKIEIEIVAIAMEK